MKYLHENGYQVITFADLVNCLKKVGKLPPKPVIISFDDGLEDQFVYALPRLEEYHYVATFFVVTNFVGSRGFVSWSKLRTIVAEGMEIGSHSRSHPYLGKIDNPHICGIKYIPANRSSRANLGRLSTSLPTHMAPTIRRPLPLSGRRGTRLLVHVASTVSNQMRMHSER